VFFLPDKNSSRDNIYWVEGKNSRMISSYFGLSVFFSKKITDITSTDQCFPANCEFVDQFTVYDKNFKFTSSYSFIGGSTNYPRKETFQNVGNSRRFQNNG